jgi:hypothetical protein
VGPVAAIRAWGINDSEAEISREPINKDLQTAVTGRKRDARVSLMSINLDERT